MSHFHVCQSKFLGRLDSKMFMQIDRCCIMANMRSETGSRLYGIILKLKKVKAN